MGEGSSRAMSAVIILVVLAMGSLKSLFREKSASPVSAHISTAALAEMELALNELVITARSPSCIITVTIKKTAVKIIAAFFFIIHHPHRNLARQRVALYMLMRAIC